MDTSSVQFTLRAKDVKKASALLEIDEATISKFNDLRLLNTTYIRSLLMRADYERLTSGLHYLSKQDKKYRYPEVVKAIAREYGIGAKAVQEILNGKNETVCFCSKCGIRISMKTARLRGGLCSNCYVDSLDL